MNKPLRRQDQLKIAAEAYFQSPVRKITSPGGSGRASQRLHFDDTTVIGSLRPNFRRTHLEAYILQRLEPFCDDIPVCFGVVENIMFQSDVGDRRLNREIVDYDSGDQVAIAEEAVAAIFRIQAAARKTELADTLPHLGSNADWIKEFVQGPQMFQDFLEQGVPDSYPVQEIAALLDCPATQFVKWDCRSGNAALDDDDRLRWFDFEYAGMRHGAEDFAWLIGDETWPLDGETMLDIVEDGFDPACGHSRADYLDYLHVYTVLHCIQRLRLIARDAPKRGWLEQERIRQKDDLGLHPAFAAHLCGVAAYFADRNPLTYMLAPLLETAEAAFRNILETGHA